MTSSDNVITIETINGGIQEIKSELAALNKRIDNLQQEIRINTVKIEAVQNSVNWSFAGATIAITAVIAIVGLVATLAPTVREFFASKKESSLEERMKEIAETAISRALARSV